MDLARKLEVLDDQVTAARNGTPENFTAWHAATEVAIRTVMGAEAPVLKQFHEVNYSPQVWASGMDTSGYRPAGVKKVIALLEAAKSELKLRAELSEDANANPTVQLTTDVEDAGLVFIIHGHDNARKHELYRILQDVTGTKPIILHEQPSGGLGILEKLEKYAASAGVAVALLTGDDLGRAKTAEAAAERARARQNVVYEAGYFSGRLGRDKVVLLHENGVELPSDLAGIVYITLDAEGAWKMRLVHELANMGIDPDWSALAGQ